MRTEVRDQTKWWGLKWHGSEAHIMWEEGKPLLFRTRQQARWYARKWHYIKNRPDLRRAPHHWRVPTPIKIQMTLEEI